VEDGFHLGAVVRLHLPQADDLTHDLGVVTDGLRLGIDIANIVGDSLLLFLKAFDALYQKAQAVVGGVGHRAESPVVAENRLSTRERPGPGGCAGWKPFPSIAAVAGRAGFHPGQWFRRGFGLEPVLPFLRGHTVNHLTRGWLVTRIARGDYPVGQAV